MDGCRITASVSEGTFLQVAQSALELWDLLPVHVSLLKIRENAVFRVDCQDGVRVALRVHRLDYHSDEELHSESEWTYALADAGVSVPRVVRSKQGASFERVHAPSVSRSFQVDILEWVEGQQLGSLEGGIAGDRDDVARNYGVVGAMAARLHNHATQWRPLAGFVRHRWCEEGLVGESPLWGRFWELDALTGPQRSMMMAARHAIFEDLLEVGKDADAFGLIHADLVPENILVHGRDVQVIDFDDAGYGWHLFDLATSLYFLRPSPHFDVAKRALIQGYRCHRTVGDEHLKKLNMFIAARSTTYLGWVHQRKGSATALDLTAYLIALSCDTVDEYLSCR